MPTAPAARRPRIADFPMEIALEDGIPTYGGGAEPPMRRLDLRHVGRRGLAYSELALPFHANGEPP